MVSFSVGLTGFVDISWYAVISVFYLANITIIGIFVVRVRFRFNTPAVIVVNASTILVVFTVIFLALELTALTVVVAWFFAVVGFGAVLSFRGFFVAWCVTVFICSSSVPSWLFSSNSFSRCGTICSDKLFSKCGWFVHFFRCGGSLAYMICAIITWTATLNASSASFWSSSRKSINFWFAGLEASRWCWS